MDPKMVVSFFRLLRTNPELAHDRKAFVKFMNKAADMEFKVRKNLIHDAIAREKNDLISCFDIYEEYAKQKGFNPVTSTEDETRDFINEVIIRLGINQKGQQPDADQD